MAPRVRASSCSPVALSSRDPSPPGMSRFWVLHAAYTSLEMIKLLVGVVVAFWIARFEREIGRSGESPA